MGPVVKKTNRQTDDWGCSGRSNLGLIHHTKHSWCCVLFIHSYTKTHCPHGVNGLFGHWSFLSKINRFCSARWILGHSAAVSPSWPWIILFGELLPMVWGRALGIRQVQGMLLGDCVAVTFHLILAVCTLRNRWMKENGLWHITAQITNTYFSFISVVGCVNRLHAGPRSFVWLRPVNEGQSLPNPSRH